MAQLALLVLGPGVLRRLPLLVEGPAHLAHRSEVDLRFFETGLIEGKRVEACSDKLRTCEAVSLKVKLAEAGGNAGLILVEALLSCAVFLVLEYCLWLRPVQSRVNNHFIVVSQAEHSHCLSGQLSPLVSPRLLHPPHILGHFLAHLLLDGVLQQLCLGHLPEALRLALQSWLRLVTALAEDVPLQLVFNCRP